MTDPASIAIAKVAAILERACYTSGVDPAEIVEVLVPKIEAAAVDAALDVWCVRDPNWRSGYVAAEFRERMARALAEAFPALVMENEGLRVRVAELEAPIDAIMYCPACFTQHVDAPDGDWGNPPHRSHLCHCCGTIWRPADVATNGVAFVKTRGSSDRGPLKSTDIIPEHDAPRWTKAKDDLLRELAEWVGHSAPRHIIEKSLIPFIDDAWPPLEVEVERVRPHNCLDRELEPTDGGASCRWPECQCDRQ
jgi:hypothetical protein